MKQTAVEFISKGLFDILQEAENNNILEVGTQNFKRYIEMFEKEAKKIEQEQDKNKYSEEEVEEIFKKAQLCSVKSDGVYFKYDSFEKFKKK